MTSDSLDKIEDGNIIYIDNNGNECKCEINGINVTLCEDIPNVIGMFRVTDIKIECDKYFDNLHETESKMNNSMAEMAFNNANGDGEYKDDVTNYIYNLTGVSKELINII